METIRITPEALDGIIQRLKMAMDAEKDYQIEIKPYDNSLKARRRALTHCWYKEIARQRNELIGESEAFCKYHYGFKIICSTDPDLAKIIRKMLDGYDYEQKLKIIEIYPEWFPILRDNGGMGVEQLGQYLTDIQRAMGAEGVFLTSPNEKEMLSYPEANR